MASLAGVSVRDQIVPVAAGQTLFEQLRAIGVNSVEVLADPLLFLPYLRAQSSPPPSLADASSIANLKGLLDGEGVRISALLIATDFSGDAADAHVDWAARVVGAARELQVPVVRIDPWTAHKELSAGQVRGNLVRRVGRLLEKTAGSGVDLGLENHGPLSNDEQFLDDLLQALPDPRLGLTLDTGNFYWYGYPLAEVYRLIEKYAPRARHTHVKNVSYPPEIAQAKRAVGYEYKQYCSALDEGNLDLRRVIGILRGGGYSRDFCIEDESLFKHPEEQRINLLRRGVRALEAALKQAEHPA